MHPTEPSAPSQFEMNYSYTEASVGNERSARVEVRSIAPDANPYMAIYTLLKTELEGPQSEEDGDKRPRTRFLPDNIYDARSTATRVRSIGPLPSRLLRCSVVLVRNTTTGWRCW